LVLGGSAAGLGTAGWVGGRGGQTGGGQAGSASPQTGNPFIARTSWALGSEVSIAVIEEDRQRAKRALAAAFEELAQVEKLMSLYRPDSQLCRLNRDGLLSDPHPHLVEVLLRSRAASEKSDGAFDVTVQPLWEVYAEAQRSGRLPGPEAIEAARSKVDWRRVEVSADRVRLLGRGTAVTLNGIAQGFAADRVADALRRHGIEHALVNTGEIGAVGGKQDGEPWTVGIRHPREPKAHLALAGLAGRSLATSGDYATRFGDDYRDHHLFDPRTGRSPAAFASVSVVAPAACEADALSTAVFVLGPEAGLQLVRSTPGAEALLVFKDGRTLATADFPTRG
jgi:thiamine biosynthesis lipoprotein